MSISWGSLDSAYVVGTGTDLALHPGAPTSSDNNSFNILVIGWKSSSTAEPSVSASTGEWHRLGISDSAVDVAVGSDTGSMSTLVYYSKGVAPTGTVVQFSGTVGVATARTANAQKSSSESWVYSYSTGSDEAYGANYSADTAPNFHTVANDLLVGCSSMNTDNGFFTSPTFSATGITFGSVTNRYDTLAGDDMRIRIDTVPVSSGTQTADCVFTANNGFPSQGTTLIIRLRVLANPTLSVVPVDEFAETAGYQITASGLSPYEELKIEATDNGRTWTIRGAELQDVTAGSFVGYDFEFPFGNTSSYGSVPIQYYVTVYAEGQEIVTVTTPTARSPFAEWVKNLSDTAIPQPLGPRSYLGVPRTPDLNIPVYVQEMEAYSRAGRILSKSEVLGRANPVVSTDVMNGRTGSFTLMVPTGTDLVGSAYVPGNIRAHMDVLQGGVVYLLRHISPWTAGFDDMYFTIDSAAVKRLNRFADMTGTDSPVIQIEVTFTEVDSPPASDSVTVLTWQDILDTYTSWQAELDSNVDWLDVLRNG